MPPRRIGELLVAEGLLTRAAVNRALGFQKSAAPRVKLGSILLTWDLVDEAHLLKALAALHRCEAVTGDMLANAPVDVVRMLPAPHAIRLNAVPYALQKSRIRVAFVNPSDLGAIDEVAALTGHICVPGVVTELRLLQAHRRFYGRSIPLELRSLVPRVEPARSSARESGAPAWIPIARKTASNESGSELPPITIPDLPIPPPPSPVHQEAATPEGKPPATTAAPPAQPPMPPPLSALRPSGEEQKGSPTWLGSPPGPPPSEAAIGMWSRASAPPPALDQEMGDLALASVPPEFPRVILLADRQGTFVGWRARGVDPENLEAISVSGAEPSVFASVRRSGTPHFGLLDSELWPHPLAKLFGGPPPCAVFPVHSTHGVEAVLYADRRGAPMKFDDTALLARAAAEIAALFARVAPGRTP